MLNPGLWQSSKYGGLHVTLCWAKDAALIQWTQWGNSDHHRGGDASRPWEEADGLEGWINLGPRRKREEENRQILPCPCLLLFPSRLLVSAQQIAPSHLRPLSREALPTEAHRAGALGPPASRQRRWPGYIIKHCCPVCYSGVWEQKRFIVLFFKLYFRPCWVFIAARAFLWSRWAARFLVAAPGLLIAEALWWHTGLVASRHVGSSWTRNLRQVSCTGKQMALYHWAITEALVFKLTFTGV